MQRKFMAGRNPAEAVPPAWRRWSYFWQKMTTLANRAWRADRDKLEWKIHEVRLEHIPCSG
jgi:hypothetical protein